MAEKGYEPEVLTVQEVAELLRVSLPTVRRWLYSGKLPSLKLASGRGSGGRRIRREDLKVFLTWREQGGEEAPGSPKAFGQGGFMALIGIGEGTEPGPAGREHDRELARRR
ncbi:MAG: helix-turn-helix domain-containing protein [Deinococcus sp.]|nr:helix-turn-helix domain-containing protein [Deinococcus sp.]